MQRATVKDVEVQNKRILVRVDFNCPIQAGEVGDDNRIVAALPTLRYLLERKARIVLMSHLGRPKGKVKPELSLAPVAQRLAALIGQPVQMAKSCLGPEVEKMVADLAPGEILLLENLRFHPEEKKNDEAFAKTLANYGEIYVNDAFGAAHRAHSSTEAVTRFLPAVAGLLVADELRVLGELLSTPRRPFVAILGGAKVSDKLGVLESLIEKADTLLIGGGMAFSFLKAQGLEIGKSLCEEDLTVTKRILQKAKEQRTTLLLPTDVAIAPEFGPGQPRQEVQADSIGVGVMGLNIGHDTVSAFSEQLATAGTIFWNGPMGVFEIKPFDYGTLEVAKAVADSSAVSCVGGGDSAAALRQMGLDDRITHVSTGGGASLEFIEGKELPGVAALRTLETIKS